jgi:hypothetical protein
MRKAAEIQVRFLTSLKCRIMTGWMSATMVLSSANKKVELRMDRTTTAHFQSVMSRGGSSSAVSAGCSDFSRSTSIVEQFSETSRVSLLGTTRKLLFDLASASFSLIFPMVEPVELI